MPEAAVLKVMVLAGGPDRERPVSLDSGANVAAALQQAGHEVIVRDILPDNLAALDEFTRWRGDAVFPILHGAWGEGGPLQEILDQRGLPYVGCRALSARLCMDKVAAKEALAAAGLPTPAWQVLHAGETCTLQTPLVLKPPCEGSSIDVVIARRSGQMAPALADLFTRHKTLLAEKFIVGRELTVGVVADPAAPGGLVALPAVRIVPATEFYDYQAKYHRDDTQYLFDLDVPPHVPAQLAQLAMAAFRSLGCRHLARVDVMLDADGRPWVIEINTLPGFTSHSLLPKAAAHAGTPTPQLVDRLARLAAGVDAHRGDPSPTP